MFSIAHSIINQYCFGQWLVAEQAPIYYLIQYWRNSKTLYYVPGHRNSLIDSPEMHFSDVIMSAMASQITCLIVVYSTVYSRRRSNKNVKAPRHRALWGEFTGDRWPVNSLPARRASNTKHVSKWWRHHGLEALRYTDMFSKACFIHVGSSAVWWLIDSTRLYVDNKHCLPNGSRHFPYKESHATRILCVPHNYIDDWKLCLKYQ